jgi:hypothetical protein
MNTANQLARRMRDETFSAPAPGSQPRAYLTVPVNVACRAVAIYHEQGAAAAAAYIGASKVARWANHRNPSMATGNTHVLRGFEAYIEADRADGRQPEALGAETVLAWPAGPLAVRFDVVLAEGAGLSGRVLFWDGLEIDRAAAELIAAPYLAALRALYPEHEIGAIGVWQGRYQQRFEVPAEIAERRAARAKIIHRGL